MSIYDARMPSLKDKIREQAEKVETEKTEEKVEKKVVIKGRRLNK